MHRLSPAPPHPPEPCAFCDGTGTRYSKYPALTELCLVCRGAGTKALDPAVRVQLAELELVRAAAGYGGGCADGEYFL